MYQDKILELLNTKTIPDVMESFSKIATSAGALYFCILGGPRNKTASLKNFYSSCPEEWIKYYREEGFLEVDPVFQAFLDPKESIYYWEASDPNCPFAKRCKDFDINCKLTFFIRSRTWHSMVIFSFKEPCKEILASPAQLSLFEAISSIVSSKIYAKTGNLPSLSLTDRELECLRWSSEGKTAEEIGLILFISHWTVTFHLKNIYKKLGVYNKTTAVLKALKSGLL
jgi:DNA-binding CsgD family transcriptional regulator